MTYYISPNGNDSNNGLNKSTSLLTFNKAHDLASNGDEVILLPGIHKFAFTTDGGGWACATIVSKKSLTIRSITAHNTFVDNSSFTSPERDGCLLTLYSGVSVIGIRFIHRPHKSYNYANAIFARPWSYYAGGQIATVPPRVYNCEFNVIGSANPKCYSYDDSNGRTGYQIFNCGFKFENPQPTNDYTPGPVHYVNCILPTKPSAAGTFNYDILRAITIDDTKKVLTDCYNLGDPGILNKNGSQSHIGLFGGPNGYLWSRISTLIMENEKLKKLTLTPPTGRTYNSKHISQRRCA